MSITLYLFNLLKDGLIVERGTHQELLAMQGQYSSMWSKQLQVDEDAVGEPDGAKKDV